MQERNYTNPEDRGRFGFSKCGEFRAPYKGETIFVIMLISAAVFAGLVLFFVLRQISTQQKPDQEAQAPFLIAGAVIAFIAFAVILIVIFGIGIRSVKKGYKCSYNANDETFTATIGGDLHIIRYQDVTDVQFRPRSSIGKIRGYDVTVKLRNGTSEVFAICSDGYLSPQATPFYIITERLEILNRSRSSPSQFYNPNTAKANTKAITQAEVERKTAGGISAMDKMAHLLGETSNMPELSSAASPLEKAEAELSKMLNEYPSNEMPAIGERARPKSDGYFIGLEGREHSLDTVQAQGVYNIRPKKLTLILIGILVAAIDVGVMMTIPKIIWDIVARDYFEQVTPDYPGLISLGLSLITVPLLLFYFITRVRGTRYNYKADGRGFYMTSKKGNDQILYKDAISIDFNLIKLLGKAYGYKVDILMTYGPVQINYMFPHFGHKLAKQFTPFEAIRRTIENREQDQQ